WPLDRVIRRFPPGNRPGGGMPPRCAAALTLRFHAPYFCVWCNRARLTPRGLPFPFSSASESRDEHRVSLGRLPPRRRVRRLPPPATGLVGRDHRHRAGRLLAAG